jgi:hypothetical protein
MLKCKESSQLISLTLRERFALKLHLYICSKCRQFSQHLQTLRVAFKTMLSSIESNNSIEMPSESKKRIALYIEEQVADAHRAKP